MRRRRRSCRATQDRGRGAQHGRRGAPHLVAQPGAETRLGALLARIGKDCRRDLAGDVVAALVALQRLVLTAPDAIHSVDVNPLMIGPEGTMAVDALVVPRRPA